MNNTKKIIFDFTEEDFNYDNLPDEVREILDRYSQEDNTYNIMEIIKEELNSIGYDLDYDLSAEILSITKI